MIELLVLIAIATIGVIYTSSTGEAESTAMAEKTAKEALNEAEGQNGIGILGIDVVARKMRDLVSKSNGIAVTADTLAEFRGVVAEDDEDEAEAQAEAPKAAHADDDIDDWDEDEEGDDWSAARAAQERWDEDASDDDWASVEDDDEVQPVNAEAPMREEAPIMDTPVETPVAKAPEAAKPAPKAPAVLDTADAPLVEDFDPEQDELQIGYRPGEAGNGRIGIAEDPLRPGSAAVTLGGRCVAVVLDGYGKVRAHHIDLVCEEDEDLAA